MKLTGVKSCGQKSRRVIINADDFGITEGVNKAISELAGAGVLTSTSVMSNMPYYDKIVRLKDEIGIGVHFNLTVGKPITESSRAPSLVSERGYFYDLPELLTRARKRIISPRDVEFELDAQVKRLIDIGIDPDHIDSHESILKYPFFSGIIKGLAKKYRIPAVRTYRPRSFDYTRLLKPRRIMISFYLAMNRLAWKRDGFRVADNYDSLIKLGLDYESACEKLREIFQNLPEGVLEIGVHPGYCDKHNGALGDYVYEREAEVQALLSEKFRDVLMNSDAELIRFSDLYVSENA